MFSSALSIFETKALVEKEKLKIVILDCYYNVHDDATAKQLFIKILSMKIAGYRGEYPYGVLPIDSGDFIGVHILLCKETDQGLQPVMGFKSVSLERCKAFHLSFPAFNLLQGLKLPMHEKIIKTLIANAEKKGQDIAYNASWTMLPETRKNDSLRKLCRDLTAFLLIRYYDFYEIPNVIAGAVVRFKADQIQKFAGFNYFADDQGSLLDPIECKFVFHEKVALMHLEKLNAEALKWAKQYDFLWDQRLVIESPEESKPAKKTAA